MLFRLFRLPPVVYFALAPIFVVLAGYLYWSLVTTNAEKAAALSHAAPEAVAVETITSDETGNDYNEVVVFGQVDANNMIEVTKKRRRGSPSYSLFIPLYPTDAADFSAPAIAVIEIDRLVSDNRLAEFYVDDGPAGPIFEVNGVWSGGGNSDATNAFLGKVELASDFRTVEPFMRGREDALKTGGNPELLIIIGLILAAVVGGYGFLRKRMLDKAREEEAAYAAAVADAEG